MTWGLDSRPFRLLFDSGLLCLIGFAVAFVIGILVDSSPFGDDSIYYVGMIRTLTSSLPFFAWDPHTFSGYTPTVGFSWLTYILPFVFAKIGFDPASAFHLSFLLAFLGLGLCVYYFARSVGAIRSVAILMAVLAWSTNAYWNNTIWGGAYNRAFSLPFMFFALGTSYRYTSRLNEGLPAGHDYWLSIIAWSLTFVGDIYVMLAGFCLGLIFLFLSACGNGITAGLKRVLSVLGPPVGLTLWQTVPVIVQAIYLGTYRNQYTVPNDWSSLLFPGTPWDPTLNIVYLPIILALTICCLLFRAKCSPIQRALLISVLIMGTYWFIMGWVPSLWSLLPRVMATNSSVENLAWIFLMTIPLIFSILSNRLSATVGAISVIKMFFTVSMNRGQLLRVLRASLIIFISVNALLVVPTIKPVNWGPLDNQLNVALNGYLGPPSNDYRVALENRYLTRSFAFYQPDRFETGGRVVSQNPNPIFENWFLTDVFYKNDPSFMSVVYVDDRPAGDFSPLLESSSNFAGTRFWLDWYGVNDLVFFPYYQLYDTIRNYTARSSLFSVISNSTYFSIPEVFVRPEDPSEILVATNATIVGFYSASRDSMTEYEDLIAMLADMGLNSRFVIPLYFQSLKDATTEPADLLVTDSDTFSQYSHELERALGTSNMLVVSSANGPLGGEPTAYYQGGGLVTLIPLSFSQLVQSGETGAYYFVKAASLAEVESIGGTSSTYFGPSMISLNSSNWVATYRTYNAQGSVQSSPDVVAVNVTNIDSNENSQFNIDYRLPEFIPLNNNVEVGFSVRTSVSLNLGVSFSSTSVCCPNYVGTNVVAASDGLVHFRIPFSEFSKWGNSSLMFGAGQDLTFAINLPASETNAVVQFSNVSITSPGYTISHLQKAISLADNGILLPSTVGASGFMLFNDNNSSTGVLGISTGQSNDPLTISSLFGGQPGQQYDQIVTVGGGQVATSVIVFLEKPWSSVHSTWTSNENMVVPLVPAGFRGLVWKETYNSLWNIVSQAGEANKPMTYYYAGPGMIYIPISTLSGSINANFISVSSYFLVAFAIEIVVAILIMIFRRDLPTIGYRRRALR